MHHYIPHENHDWHGNNDHVSPIYGHQYTIMILMMMMMMVRGVLEQEQLEEARGLGGALGETNAPL